MTDSLSQSDLIERELAALGEEPLQDDELAMLAGEAQALDGEPAVASTARLFELAQPYDHADHAELSELAKQRIWRTVDSRPRPSGVGRRGREVGLVAVVLALAAALVLVVVDLDDERSPPEPRDREVAALADQTRSALRALDDGLGDTARAERLTSEYQQRLEGR